MFQSILVPLDGSVRAEQAIPVAARVARASAGSLTLLRVLSSTSARWSRLPTAPTWKRLMSIYKPWHKVPIWPTSRCAPRCIQA
jgi:nucleotide-binding universal stress UspA family protein